METTYDLTNNRKLKIVHDSSPDNPRSWDNLAKFIFTNTKKSLGDNHDFKHNDYNDWHEFQRAVEREFKVAIIKPIYMYSHSGETIRTTPFNCPFDSGQIGFVIVTKEDIRKEYNVKNVTAKQRELAEQVIQGEVETLDQYISGDVYGFKVVDEDDNEEDSCYGFYGSDITVNGMLDYLLEEDRVTVLNQIK